MWCAQAFSGERRKYIYGKTRHEVMQRLRQVQMEFGDGFANQQPAPRLADFLHTWLESSVKPRVRPLTYAGYKVNVEKHLIPTLGRIKLDQLTPQHVQGMINNRLAAGFSTKTVAYVHQVLRTALSLAVRWEVVPRNVAKLVDKPKVERKPINPLTPDEARKFLAAIRGHRLEALFTVALALGLRQGEALGLRWQDVDFVAGTLRVSNQLQRINGRLTLVPPKTAKSRRTLSSLGA